MATYDNSKLNSYDNLVSEAKNESIDSMISGLSDNEVAFYLFDEHEDLSLIHI